MRMQAMGAIARLQTLCSAAAASCKSEHISCSVQGALLNGLLLMAVG